MLRAIYRAIIIGRAKSAAEHITKHLSAEQLQDIGHTKRTLIEQSVANVTKELDQAETERNNRKIRYPKKPGLWVAYKYFHFEKPV